MVGGGLPDSAVSTEEWLCRSFLWAGHLSVHILAGIPAGAVGPGSGQYEEPVSRRASLQHERPGRVGVSSWRLPCLLRAAL